MITSSPIITIHKSISNQRNNKSNQIGVYPPGSGPKYPFQTAPSKQTEALPLALQPVPIHTVQINTDFLLRSYENCKRYEEYLQQDVYTSQIAVEKAKENADLFDLLSSAFDMTVDYDNFYCLF